MLLGKAQNIIGHSPELTRRFAVAHNAAYQHCDIDKLMATCSPRGGIWAGLLPPDSFVVNETPEEVSASYVKLIEDFKVLPPTIFSMICTDWYACFEVTSKLVHRASDQVMENQAICLFGNDELGTAVDMAWPYGPEPGSARAKRDAGGALRSELIDLAAHEKRLDGWRTADVNAATHGLAQQGVFFLPVFDPDDARRAVGVTGTTDYAAWLKALFDLYEVTSITPTNIHVGDRHVFSETVWKVKARKDGSSLAFRYALVEILMGDEIGGMLGFATRFD